MRSAHISHSFYELKASVLVTYRQMKVETEVSHTSHGRLWNAFLIVICFLREQ